MGTGNFAGELRCDADMRITRQCGQKGVGAAHYAHEAMLMKSPRIAPPGVTLKDTRDPEIAPVPSE